MDSHRAWYLLVCAVVLASSLAGAQAARAQEVGTEDASGCNIDVCIALEGTGLTVDRWRTTGYESGSHCNYVYFWRNDTIIRTHYVCGTGQLATSWNSPGSFSDGDVLCNTWSGISGKPCKTIHA